MKINWAQRLSPTVRVCLMLLLSLALVMMLGVIAGFTMSALEHDGGSHKPIFYVGLAVMVGITGLMVWALTILVRSRHAPDVSPYDRRYHRMWAILAACGLPIGVGLALADRPSERQVSMFNNSSIDPLWAIALAAATAVLFTVAAVVYHRTVDDHEERAYLWGSTIAYYFILIAFPVAWLLARGGLVEKLGIGSATIILGISMVVQTAVWLRFKFR